MTSMRYTFNGILTFADYTYDNIGNIKSSKYTYDDKVYSEVAYVYDDHNRLIAENCTNSNVGITPYMSSYSFDSFGNITETERPNSAGVTVKNTYSYENSSWRDLLTAYNGHTITYDKIGNPLSYYNGRSYTLRWEMGRQLLSSRVNSRTVYYDYNKDGMRIKKNVSGRYTDRYILDGSKVIGMERTKSGSSVKDVYHFIYDEMGNIWSAICYIGGSTTPVRYFYRTNAQGDVKQIVDSNYNVVAYYAYDAWGKLLAVLDGNDNPITDSSHFANVNPFRYRGYVYDTETGFYYVSSRYYDPEIGRYLNADSVIAGVGGSVQGYNLFAYCFNNPVNMSDSSGHWPQWIKDAASWVNNNIIQPVKNFFSSSKQSNVVNAYSHDANRRPYTGEPGSTYTAPNGDSRTYGPDGTPEHDYDHDDHRRPDKHPHDSNGGHNHDWENGVRGPAYSIGWEPIAGVALVTVCAI